jgi:DNA anti-recombination protein RmuC
MVRQAYSNFKVQENVHEIVTHIKQFEKQFDLYNVEFEKLGSQIDSLSNTYQKVGSTRTRQLTRLVEKIKLEGSVEPMEPKLDIPIKPNLESDETIH